VGRVWTLALGDDYEKWIRPALGLGQRIVGTHNWPFLLREPPLSPQFDSLMRLSLWAVSRYCDRKLIGISRIQAKAIFEFGS
jgi:hypothetical protein